MNHSMFTADRLTHLKIVVVALFAATVVTGVGVTARWNGASNTGMQTAVYKAGKPVTAANSDVSTVR